MSVDDDNVISMSVDMKERSIYKRDPCVRCNRLNDMLRVESNNRICDICNEGPICWDCYQKKGEWLNVCVCDKCADSDTSKLSVISVLVISGEYKPRFYKPNIQPLCEFCQERFATVCCDDCEQPQCDYCFGTCESCTKRFCTGCDNWSEIECSCCGNPYHGCDPDDDDDLGKRYTTWEEARLQHPFGYFWK